MNDWLSNLPVLWMALLVFAGTYLFTAAILFVVGRTESAGSRSAMS
jgi:cyanate permease